MNWVDQSLSKMSYIHFSSVSIHFCLLYVGELVTLRHVVKKSGKKMVDHGFILLSQDWTQDVKGAGIGYSLQTVDWKPDHGFYSLMTLWPTFLFWLYWNVCWVNDFSHSLQAQHLMELNECVWAWFYTVLIWRPDRDWCSCSSSGLQRVKLN